MMNDDNVPWGELWKHLDSLGAKLEKAGSTVWAWQVRQSYINGAECTFCAILVVIVAVWGHYSLVRWGKTLEQGSEDSYTAKALSIVVLVVSFPLIVALVVNALDLLLNPQYWALHDLIRSL